MRRVHSTLLGPFLLVLVSLLWGTSFPLIKLVVLNISAGEYVAFRFLLSVVLILPYIANRLLKNRGRLIRAARPGMLLGFLYFGGIILQGLGTAYTSASNSGFITSLYIPIVYAIDVMWHRSNYSHKLTLALIFSLIGMYLISGGSYESRIGDLLVLAGAFFWAFQVLAVDSFSKKHSSLDLVFFQYAVTAAMGFATTPFQLSFEKMTKVFHILLYLAAVCSVIVGALQIIGQKYTSASLAVLIYALEPIFAAVFSFLIRGERLGVVESLGAILILVSVIISLWGTSSKKYSPDSRT